VWGEKFGLCFVKEDELSKANYWLNCLILKSKRERDSFIKFTQENGIMTRPTWTPMHRLKIYRDCFKDNLENTQWISDRLVNVPSSPIT
jgi:dTDP-4-amino-4,6-dideoxygalactose transaminase